MTLFRFHCDIATLCVCFLFCSLRYNFLHTNNSCVINWGMINKMKQEFYLLLLLLSLSLNINFSVCFFFIIISNHNNNNNNKKRKWIHATRYGMVCYVIIKKLKGWMYFYSKYRVFYLCMTSLAILQQLEKHEKM